MKSECTKRASIASSMLRNSPKRSTSFTRSKRGRAKRAGTTSRPAGAASRKSPPRETLEDIVEHVTPADGNIFADLGFPPDEARRLLLQSQLSVEIGGVIEQRR